MLWKILLVIFSFFSFFFIEDTRKRIFYIGIFNLYIYLNDIITIIISYSQYIIIVFFILLKIIIISNLFNNTPILLKKIINK